MEKEPDAIVYRCAFEVMKHLSTGHTEKTYQHALCQELRTLYPAKVTTEVTIPIDYKGINIGNHRLDILVAGEFVVECKAVASLGEKDRAQSFAYSRAMGMPVVLVNFCYRTAEPEVVLVKAGV